MWRKGCNLIQAFAGACNNNNNKCIHSSSPCGHVARQCKLAFYMDATDICHCNAYQQCLEYCEHDRINVLYRRWLLTLGKQNPSTVGQRDITHTMTKWIFFHVLNVEQITCMPWCQINDLQLESKQLYSVKSQYHTEQLILVPFTSLQYSHNSTGGMTSYHCMYIHIEVKQI